MDFFQKFLKDHGPFVGDFPSSTIVCNNFVVSIHQLGFREQLQGCLLLIHSMNTSCKILYSERMHQFPMGNRKLVQVPYGTYRNGPKY